MDRVIFSEKKFIDSPQSVLAHYGMPRRSGRYPWGSGDNPYQRTPGFRANIDAMLSDWIKTYGEDRITTEAQRQRAVSRAYNDIAKAMGMSIAEFRYYTYDDLKQSGKSQKEIADGMGMSISELRSWITTNKAQQTVLDVAEVNALKNKGYSNVAIGERMGYSEGTVRNLLKPGADEKARQTTAIIEALKESVDEKGYVDVGQDVNRYLGISKTKLDACVDALKEEGYNVYWNQAEQFGTGKETTFKVLASPDKGWKEFRDSFAADPSIVKSIGLYSDDRGETVTKVTPPKSINSKRILIRYGDEGGVEKDGLIEVRPGAKDLDLGDSLYAQVRVAVDGKYYMKGMAVRGDIPEGYDVVYNTNKPSGTDPTKVFKPMKTTPDGDIDMENPFGASITAQKGAFNIVNEEGTWSEWSKSLPSQFLSKQSPELAKKQLSIAYQSKKDTFDEIMALTNPTVRKKMLEELADSCDSDAENLKGAALPRQKTQVILPVPEMSPNEVYAPNFRDGEKVVLVRFPHGGPFESPELTVNNKNPAAKKLIGSGVDAVGINSKVAERLSGADFDGDNVLVIPNNDGKIKTQKPLALLEGFDPKVSFPLPENSPDRDIPEKRRESVKNTEMGKVSNLITDMTLKGANSEEISRAVAHSMVVIDSVKHNLDYKASYKYYGIEDLKRKYQGQTESGQVKGASTIISRASAEVRVMERKELTSTRGMTPDELAAWNRGERVYRDTGRTYVDRNTGSTKVAVTKTTGMQAVKDARQLSSGTQMEEIYVNYANSMKSLANRARAEARTTPRLEQSPSAKRTYAKEVDSLNTKLNVAAMNAPRERQAVLVSNAVVRQQKRDNPEMSRDQEKKAKNKALSRARERLGSNKRSVQVQITPREWEAIQAGAISDSMLSRILSNTDMDTVRKYATPRTSVGLSDSQISRIQSMYARGMTQSEIADVIGVSTSAVLNAVNK